MSFQLILSPLAMADQATTGTDAYVATGNASDITLESQFVKSLMMTGSGVVGSALILCKSTIANGSQVTPSGLAATTAFTTGAAAFTTAATTFAATSGIFTTELAIAASPGAALSATIPATNTSIIGLNTKTTTSNTTEIGNDAKGIAADATAAAAATPAIVAATDPVAPPSTTPAGRTPNTYKTNSHYIFAGGALVLLLAELAAAIKQKDNLAESNKQAERMSVVANTPTADLTDEQKNVQLTALRLAKTEEENQRDALEARVNWMGAVEIVYWLAVAAASTEAILYASTKTLMKTSNTTQLTETTALATLTTALGALDIALAAHGCALDLEGGLFKLSLGPQAVATASAYAAASAASVITLAAYNAALVAYNSALAAYNLAVAAKIAAYKAEKALGYYSWGLTCNNYAKHKALTLGIAAAYGVLGGLNTAEINVGSVLSSAMTTAGAMMMLNFIVDTGVGKTLGKVVNTAPGRVVIFGTFATLADVVRNAFKDRVLRANKNIQSIDTAITTWTNATKGGSVTGGSGGDDPTTNSNLNLATNKSSNYLQRLPSVPKSAKCFSASAQVSGNSCRNPIKFNRGSLNFRSSFLNGTANQAFEMGEAFARDDGARASSLAASMGTNAARVKAEAKGLIAEANAALMRNGGKAIDFDKQVKAQLASFGQANMGGSGSGSASAGSGTRASLDEDAMESQSVPSSVAVSYPGAIGQPAADLAFPADEGITTEPIVEAKADQNLDDFESSVQDVARKDDVSIFKQLSNRYILNYTKIFDRKKEEIPVVPDAPKKE